MGNLTVPSTSFKLDTTVMARATAPVLSIRAVDQRDVVPESVGHAIFELRNAMGP